VQLSILTFRSLAEGKKFPIMRHPPDKKEISKRDNLIEIFNLTFHWSVTNIFRAFLTTVTMRSVLQLNWTKFLRGMVKNGISSLFIENLPLKNRTSFLYTGQSFVIALTFNTS
jgi:hypothetical protein